jgi:regulator of sirC expression with transglutaminase-like and TPR domain
MALTFASDIEFTKLLAQQTGINLVRLMLEFATDAYDGIDARHCLAEIDALADQAAQRVAELGPEASLREKLQAVSLMLYDEEGFRGNREDYYDPRNSYINELLSRREGIPISLGILYMAVAQRAGLPVYGVSSPGHFMLGCRLEGEIWFVDPFDRGEELSPEASLRRLDRINGKPGSVSEEDLQPATMLEIAVRVLRNLKAAYAMRNRWQEALPVQKRLTLLLPELPDERRDLGLIYMRTGHVYRAIQLLEQYLSQCDCDQAEMVRPYLITARRMLAEMN